MKKLIGMLALAVAFSSSAIAAPGNHEACKKAGEMAESSLPLAKAGVNPTETLLSDPDRLAKIDSHTLFIMASVTMDVWENRNVYNKLRAYMAGYRICMTLY